MYIKNFQIILNNIDNYLRKIINYVTQTKPKRQNVKQSDANKLYNFLQVLSYNYLKESIFKMLFLELWWFCNVCIHFRFVFCIKEICGISLMKSLEVYEFDVETNQFWWLMKYQNLIKVTNKNIIIDLCYYIILYGLVSVSVNAIAQSVEKLESQTIVLLQNIIFVNFENGKMLYLFNKLMQYLTVPNVQYNIIISLCCDLNLDRY